MAAGSYIVCGWHTEAYAPSADQLRSNLSRFAARHDIVSVPALPGGWERNTLRKPEMLLAAMNAHPNDTVIFLDVDCEVFDSLRPLANIRGDIGLFFRSKTRHNGKTRLSIRSGTIVANRTEATLRFVRGWIALSREAPRGAVDQTTLPLALAQASGLSVDVIHPKYCAVPADELSNPVVLHGNASSQTKKIPDWLRAFHSIRHRARV